MGVQGKAGELFDAGHFVVGQYSFAVKRPVEVVSESASFGIEAENYVDFFQGIDVGEGAKDFAIGDGVSEEHMAMGAHGQCESAGGFRRAEAQGEVRVVAGGQEFAFEFNSDRAGGGDLFELYV